MTTALAVALASAPAATVRAPYDRVMRGGMLLACHHGLGDAQLDSVHACVRDFAAEKR